MGCVEGVWSRWKLLSGVKSSYKDTNALVIKVNGEAGG